MLTFLRITMMVLFSILSLSVQAQNSTDFEEDEIDCEEEFRLCAKLSFVGADKELNEVYKELVTSYEQALQEERARGKKEKKIDYIQRQLHHLRQSQRDWIKFRDSFCDYKAIDEWGGTWPLVLMDCLTLMTEEQTKRLRDSSE